MQRRALAVAQIDVGARHLLHHEGKILRAHARWLVAIDIGLADHVRRDIAEDLRLLGIVHKRREDLAEIDRGDRTEAGRHAFGHPDHVGLDQIHRLRAEGARGAGNRGVLRNDVIGVAAHHLGDAQHRRVGRAHVPRDDGLQRGGDVAGRQHRVDTFLRPRAVRAPPAHGDIEERAPGHLRTRRDRELAQRHVGPVVDGVDRVAGKPLEQPVLQHRQGPAGALLAGLEDEVHRAVEVAGFRQVSRRAQQHRGVPVMAAGVHLAGGAAGIGNVVRLAHRQRIHVRPKPHRLVAVAGPQHAHHAGAADAAMHLDPPFLQLARDQIGGAMLLHAELGMGVDVVADGRQLVVVFADFVDGGGHGFLLEG